MAECPIKEGDRVYIKGLNIMLVVDTVNTNTWRCKCVYFDPKTNDFKFVEVSYKTLQTRD